MTKITPCISICLIPSDLYKIYEVVSDGHQKTLCVPTRCTCIPAGDLIYGVRLKMDVGDRLAETCF